MRRLVPFSLGCLLALSTQATALSVILEWDYEQGAAPIPQATSFNVYRQDNCLGAWLWKANPPLSAQQWEDRDVQGGTTYCWRVTAVAGQAESAASNTVAVQVVPPVPQTPVAPSNVRARVAP